MSNAASPNPLPATILCTRIHNNEVSTNSTLHPKVLINFLEKSLLLAQNVAIAVDCTNNELRLYNTIQHEIQSAQFSSSQSNRIHLLKVDPW
jgi:hypothetical protein